MTFRSLLFAGLALASAASHASLPAPGADACAQALSHTAQPGTGAAPDPAWLTALLDAVSAPSEPALTEALRRVPAGNAHEPLADRARVVLAALALAHSPAQTASARQTLRDVRLDSEAALDASLLMAESFALDGNLDEALRWNLRTLQRWPAEPAAIEAVVVRARAAGDMDRRQALAALDTARSVALASLGDLQSLASRLADAQWFDRWLEEGAEPPLSPELVPVFYRTLASDDFRAARGAALAARWPGLCAREQLARIRDAGASLERLEREARQALAKLVPRQVQARAAYERARDEYLAANPRDQQAGQRVNALRNAAARDGATIASLQQTIAALPASRERLATRASGLAAVAGNVGSDGETRVLTALHDTLITRQARLRDLAGMASLYRGELLEPRRAAR